eukprot:5502668-Amphidinium_carterae.1
MLDQGEFIAVAESLKMCHSASETAFTQHYPHSRHDSPSHVHKGWSREFTKCIELMEGRGEPAK